jgi:hypothetical protein
MKTNVVMTPQGVEVVVSFRSTPLKAQIKFTPLTATALQTVHDWLENEGFFHLVAGRIPGSDLTSAARLIRSLKL